MEPMGLKYNSGCDWRGCFYVVFYLDIVQINVWFIG